PNRAATAEFSISMLLIFLFFVLYVSRFSMVCMWSASENPLYASRNVFYESGQGYEL
ncbi:hypothetical protein L9F63_017715, partial [Diploptera punctata]